MVADGLNKLGYISTVRVSIVVSPAAATRRIGFNVEPNLTIVSPTEVANQLINLICCTLSSAGEHVNIHVFYPRGSRIVNIGDSIPIHGSVRAPCTGYHKGHPLILYALEGIHRQSS